MSYEYHYEYNRHERLRYRGQPWVSYDVYQGRLRLRREEQEKEARMVEVTVDAGGERKLVDVYRGKAFSVNGPGRDGEVVVRLTEASWSVRPAPGRIEPPVVHADGGVVGVRWEPPSAEPSGEWPRDTVLRDGVSIYSTLGDAAGWFLDHLAPSGERLYSISRERTVTETSPAARVVVPPPRPAPRLTAEARREIFSAIHASSDRAAAVIARLIAEGRGLEP